MILQIETLIYIFRAAFALLYKCPKSFEKFRCIRVA